MTHAAGSGSIDVDPRRAAEMLAGGAMLIDVREEYERRAGHIAGSDHIDLAGLTAAAPDIPRDEPVVFYCRVGGRSAMAAQAFRAAGYEAYNLAGGILAWVAAGLPLAPEGGYVADH